MFERKGLILLFLIVIGSLASGLMLVLSREAATLKAMKSAVEMCNEQNLLIDHIEISRVTLIIDIETKSLVWHVDMGGSLVRRAGDEVSFVLGTSIFVDLFTGKIIICTGYGGSDL